MTADSPGRALFIVDNSVSGGWPGLRSLEDWSGIAEAFDTSANEGEIQVIVELVEVLEG